ncbi:hypothetical protein IM774_07475 [Erysipelotrichaceae bacterium RD49]|nr:hypothetical protein [Erysipelotrichaceae bacterium RD49]
MSVKLVNPFDDKELLNTLKEFGFDLKKDIKDTELGQSGYNELMQDLSFDLENCKFGAKLHQHENGTLVAYKIRHKDSNRSIGKSKAYRIIYIVYLTEEIAFICHIYHKVSGKKPKSDLSQSEKDNLNALIDALAQQEE